MSSRRLGSLAYRSHNGTMPNRRQFRDVAYGILGHFVRDTPWDPEWWPLGSIGRAYRQGVGGRYSFDMVVGSVAPTTIELLSIADQLRMDLRRHLHLRRLPPEWVTDAVLEVEATPSPSVPRNLRVMCRVTLIDDRGVEHTSATCTTVPLPARRLASWIGRSRPRRD